jgi:uncharacterized protein YndB with AHSA1/START domain
MKILKIIGIGILSIIALILIAALFIDTKYEIIREVVINKPNAEVFDFVKHIKNQDRYSVWNMADPNKKQTFTGTDGTVGFKNYWNGNDDAGEGEQVITGIIPNHRVDVEITFKRPFESTMQGYTATEEVNANSTKVTSVTYGNSGYPMNIMNPAIDKMLGKDIQANLNNLKTLLENQ